MNQYKVSVIIPVYNAEYTIYNTVKSILENTVKDIEILLIDDCSNDTSWNICKKLSEEFNNIVSIRNKKNSGVSYTRNKGIKLAHAPYIMFVDSDDIVSEKYIEEMLTAANLFENKMIISGFNLITNNSKSTYIFNERTKEKYLNIKKNDLFSLLDKNLIQFCWNKIFKRNLIINNNVKFNETKFMGEDFEFVLDYMIVLGIRECVIINKPLYGYYRVNQNTLMSNYGWTPIEDEYQRIDKLAILADNTQPIINRANLQKQIIRNNMVRYVVRTSGISVLKKLTRIEHLMKDHKFIFYYIKESILIFKEKVKGILQKVNKNNTDNL